MAPNALAAAATPTTPSSKSAAGSAIPAEVLAPSGATEAAVTATATADTFIAHAKLRRSLYDLSPTLPVPESRIREIIAEAVLHAPSCYNSQTSRVVLLLGDHHARFWDLAVQHALPIFPEGPVRVRISAMAAQHRASAGTALFFEDAVGLEALRLKAGLPADKLDRFGAQAAAIAQYAAWTALAAERVGGNLQHYTMPALSEAVRQEWAVPESWQLDAQLVFGGITGEPMPKEFMPIEERMRVFE